MVICSPVAAQLRKIFEFRGRLTPQERLASMLSPLRGGWSDFLLWAVPLPSRRYPGWGPVYSHQQKGCYFDLSNDGSIHRGGFWVHPQNQWEVSIQTFASYGSWPEENCGFWSWLWWLPLRRGDVVEVIRFYRTARPNCLRCKCLIGFISSTTEKQLIS